MVCVHNWRAEYLLWRGTGLEEQLVWGAEQSFTKKHQDQSVDLFLNWALNIRCG